MKTFIDKNKNKLDEISEKVKSLIEKMDLDSEDTITISECIHIIGEIHKIITLNKDIQEELDRQEDSKKAGTLLALTVYIILSDPIKSVLKENQVKELEKYSKDAKLVENVLNLVNWVANKALLAIDPNNDNKVTKEEFTECCVKCCHCCPTVGKKIGSCWAWWCINVCCCNCGDNKVEYKS